MKPAKKAYLYLLLAAIIWGVAGPVIKIGLDDLSYDVFLTGRFLISALIAIPFLLNFKTKTNMRPYSNLEKSQGVITFIVIKNTLMGVMRILDRPRDL